MINLDNIAAAAAQRHSDFIGLLLKDARDNEVGSPYREMLQRGVRYIASERAEAFNTSKNVSDAATKAVNTFFGTDIPSAHVGAVDRFIPFVATQASADIKSALAHSVAIKAQTRLISQSNKHLSKSQVDAEALKRSPYTSYFIDKSGKRWNGDVYIKTLWRQFFVNDLAEATIAALLENKQTTAKLITSAPGKPGNNVIFTLTNDFSLPTWAEVRDKYFHPNTSIIVAPTGANNGFSV